MRHYLLIAGTIVSIPFLFVFGLGCIIVAAPFALYDFYFGDRRGEAYNFLAGARALVTVVAMGDREDAGAKH